MNIYQTVALNEQAALGQKIKAYVAEKSGYSGLKTAGAMTADINRKAGEAAHHNRVADGQEALSNKYANIADNRHHHGTDREVFDAKKQENFYALHAGKNRMRAIRAEDEANKKYREQQDMRESAKRKMENFGTNTGSIGGTIIGAAAGKGYSVYKRHKMKKQGATKKELAAHKKGDLNRMLVGASIGGLALRKGGKAIGGKIADRTFNKECERLNKIEGG